MRRVERSFVAYLVAVTCVMAMVSACGGGTTDPCEGLTNTCTVEGTHRCTSDNTGREACEKNADNCLVWGQAVACGELQTCQSSGNDATCRCNNACATAGETQCNGNVIETCTNNTAGCRYWAAGTDCAQTGKLCDDSAEPAVCAETCTPACTEGDTRCNNDAVEGCTKVSGCERWVRSVDCAASGQMCSEITGTASCYATCQDDCTTEDATQCGGQYIQTCSRDGDADICLEWTNTTDCAATNPTDVCSTAGGTPACVCSDECPGAGVKMCDDTNTNELWTCAADGDADACLEWKFEADCTQGGASTDVCQEANNTAACVCTDECAAGGSRCQGNNLEVCAADGDQDTCLEWKFDTDCTQGGTATDICGISGGQAQCLCINECTPADALRCDANFEWLQKCKADGDADSCLEWANEEDCTQLGPNAACSLEGGTAHCAAGCTNDCNTEGATQCLVEGTTHSVQTCTLLGDGCRHWVAAACVDPNTFCEVAGGTAQCINPCDALVFQPVRTSGGAAYANQDFEAANDAYDIFMADDIIVAGTWEVNNIYVPATCGNGGTTLANANSLNFAICADSGGRPACNRPDTGTALWRLSVAPDDPQVTLMNDLNAGIFGTVYLRLDTPLSLSAGTYWFAFWPSMDFATGGQSYWYVSSTLNGATALRENPGGGFGSVPTSWGAIPTPHHDLAFGMWQGSHCCPNTCAALNVTRCSPDGLNIQTCQRPDPTCGESGYNWVVTTPCPPATPYCNPATTACEAGGLACENDLGSAVGEPVASGNNTGAGDQFHGTCNGGTGGLDVCYRWTVPADGLYEFNTIGSTTLTDTVIIIYRGFTQIACNDDISGSDYLSQLALQLTAGDQLLVVVDGYDASSVGDFVLNIFLVQDESVCDDFGDNDWDDWADCSDTTDCQGTAGCTPGAGDAGVACTAHTNCYATAGDPACISNAFGWGNGYCSEWCDDTQDPCPSGAVCVGFGYPNRGLCMHFCTGNGDCRSDTWTSGTASCSYTCQAVGGGNNACMPYCE